jgi:hypothetical protein
MSDRIERARKMQHVDGCQCLFVYHYKDQNIPEIVDIKMIDTRCYGNFRNAK